MFRISEAEIKKFEEYEKMISLNQQDIIEDEALPGNLAFMGLKKHQVAYGLATNLLSEKIDLNKLAHQAILGLALQAQNNPNTWSNLTPDEHMTLLHLYSAQLDEKHRQYHLNEVAVKILGSTVILGASFVTGPASSFIARATSLVLNMLGGQSTNTIGQEVLQHLHPDLFEGEYLTKILDKRFKLNPEGLQYILARIHRNKKPEFASKKEPYIKQIAKELADRKEEKKPAHSKSDVDLMQILSPVLSESIKPLVDNLVQAWTDDSIEGFESEETIVKLQGELKALKEIKAEPNALLEKANELKNQKVVITCERIQFDKMIENTGHLVSCASSLALLFDNPRLAKEITVFANTSLQAGHIIAGLCGFGTLAASINPYMAISTLLNCVTQIAALGAKDPSQLMLSGIFELKQQIESFRQEMHIRFDEVMRGLNSLEQQQLRHFCEMKRDNESILYTLRLIRRDHEQYRLETGDQLKQIIQGLDELSKTLKNQGKRDALRTILSDVRKQIEEKKMNAHAYESARATLINFVETLGSGATHEDLTGLAVKPDDFHLLDATLDEISAEFNLNTLAHYFSKHHADDLTQYTPDQIKQILSDILSSDTDFALADMVNMKHLFKSQPKSIKINSLLLTLNQFMSSSTPILVVPIQINARWNLMVIHKKTETAALFACTIHQDILTRINEILIISGIKKDKISTHIIPEVAPNLSGTWLVEAAKVLVNKCKDEMHANELTAIKVAPSRFKEHLTEHKLLADAWNTTLPNPRILRFLSFQLLQLTYSHYPTLGAESFPINPCEVEGMQASLDQAEIVYQFFTQCFDKTFFDKLINDYRSALKDVFELIQKRAKEFEITLSDELNTKAKELSRTAYFSDRDIQRFMQEEIPINAYGGWFNRKGGGKSYMENHRGASHRNEWCYNQPNHPFGSDATYYAAQKEQIVSFKNGFMKQRQLEFDSHKFKNKYKISSSMFGDFNELKEIDLPTLIVPQDRKAELPLLPAPKDLFTYLSAETQKYIIRAQALCIGHLNYTYEIVAGSFCININFEVYHGTRKGNLPITQLATKYNPLFYRGKEAAWWYWSGGKIPVTEESTMLHVATSTTTHNHFHQYAYVPTKVTKKGVIYVDAIKEEHSLELKQSQPERTIELDMSIDEEYEQLRIKFYGKIAGECERSVSELGKAVTRLNAQYKLLHLFTQLLFPFACNDANSPIHNYFNKYAGIKNKVDLLTALQGFSFHCIGSGFIFYNPDVDKLHSEIHKMIDMITYSARLKSLDEIQMHLLNTLDDLVPNLCAGPSITDKAKFYEAMAAVEGDVLSRLSTMSSDDFARAQSALKQGLSMKAELETKFAQGEKLDTVLMLQPLQNLLTGPSLGGENKEPAKAAQASSVGLWAGKRQLHSQSGLEFKVNAKVEWR